MASVIALHIILDFGMHFLNRRVVSAAEGPLLLCWKVGKLFSLRTCRLVLEVGQRCLCLGFLIRRNTSAGGVHCSSGEHRGWEPEGGLCWLLGRRAPRPAGPWLPLYCVQWRWLSLSILLTVRGNGFL